MNKNTFKTVKLSKGEMNIYNFGNIRLHAYRTNDFMDDEVFIVEKTIRSSSLNPPAFLITIKSLQNT